MPEEKKQLSVGLLQAIANYLSTKPFNEVSGMLNAINQEANTPPTPPAPPKPEAPKPVKK